MSYSLKQVLMERDGMEPADADMEIQNIKFRVYNGESAEITYRYRIPRQDVGCVSHSLH